jgi:CheY-like chemotaxis protein
MIPQRKILLHLEDDQDDQLMFKEVVHRICSDVHIIHANNGDDGWNSLLKCKAEADLPHLIIVDLNMPGMDGKQFIKKVKIDDRFLFIPIVIFTTSSSPLDKLFADKEQVKIFTKPICEGEFLAMVKTILEEQLF